MKSVPKVKGKAAMSTNELSYDDIRSLVQGAINESLGTDSSGYSRFWIRDLYPASVVYSSYEDSKLFRCSYMLEADGTVTLGAPVEVVERKSYETVQVATFSITSSVAYPEGDFMVYPDTKIFEAGEYPDKGVTVTADDLKLMADRFQPVPGDLEHIFAQLPAEQHGTLSALKGELGQLRSVKLGTGTDATSLYGEVLVPLWLDRKLPGKGVSIEFPIEGDRFISGYTLTTSPRVPDAVLMSSLVEFAGKRHSKSDLAAIQQIHDLTASQGAACAKAKGTATYSDPKANPSTPTKKEKPRMEKKTFKDKFMALFAELEDDPDAGDVSTVPPTDGPPPTPYPQPPAPTATEQALMSQVNQLMRANREAAATAAFSTFMAEGFLTPAQRPWFLAEHIQRATDDALQAAGKPVVTFSDAAGNTVTPTSRVAMLHDFVKTFPARPVTAPLDGQGNGVHVIPGAVVFTNQSAPNQADDLKALHDATLNAELASRGISPNGAGTNGNGTGK